MTDLLTMFLDLHGTNFKYLSGGMIYFRWRLFKLFQGGQ